MFGDAMMLGNYERNVDGKGRIFLPSCCHTELGDELIFYLQDDYIEVWNQKDFMEFMEELSDNHYMYQDEVTAFVSEVISVSEVKGTFRINLGISLISDYQLQDGVIIEGKGKCIRIWNKDKFQQYKNELKPVNLLTLKRKK